MALVLSCSGDDSGSANDSSDDWFNEAAVIEVHRPYWPNASEAELADLAATTRELCTRDFEDRTDQVSFGSLLGQERFREQAEAGCPAVVAEFEARFGAVETP